MKTEIHRAENLKGSVYLEKPSEDGAPREKRGIEPFKSLLEFLRAHPSRNKCDMFHALEAPTRADASDPGSYTSLRSGPC